jgi:hypothetical protein
VPRTPGETTPTMSLAYCRGTNVTAEHNVETHDAAAVIEAVALAIRLASWAAI